MLRVGYFLVTLVITANAHAALTDFSVGWIARTPRIDYVWDSANPAVDGWPASGSEVTWIANVWWLGNEAVDGVEYRWLIDGAVVKTGTLDFTRRSLATAELPWIWTFARHEIVFEIDPANAVEEVEERNNRLLVYSNAISIGIYVERTMWEGMQEKLPAVNIGATTFEDWQQLQIRHFNEMARYALYDDTPEGVIDRWRIDAIHLVEDGALPFVYPYPEARDWGAGAGSLAALYPNVRDYSVDMQWGYPAKALDFWKTVEPTAWVFLLGNANVHELGHARTMIDAYAWNLDVTNDDLRMSSQPPVTNGRYHATREHGLMHFNWGRIDRYSAVAMNRMAGWRARRGNYNEPWDVGWFLNDLPRQNRVRFLRPDGTRIANANVRIYRTTAETYDWKTQGPYRMIFDATADAQLRTDANGMVDVGRNPFSDGDVVSSVDRMNGVAVVEIDDRGTRRWGYLESLQFNLAYWRGGTDVAEYDVVAGAPVCTDVLGPSNVRPAHEQLVTAPEVKFEFPAVAGRTYELFYAVDGGQPVSVPVPATSQNTRSVRLALPPGRIVWWFEGITSSCPKQRSTLYAFDYTPQTPPRRRSSRKP